jgi:oxygen-dependent protoporphyrinogen oxidase
MSVSVAIIGGGITGLAAAYELATRGVPFVLLEASDRTGGLIRTEHVEGCTIDSGADSMLTQKPAGIRLCEELGLGSRLIASTPPRTAYVHARGRLYALPSPSVFGIPTTWPGFLTYDLLPWPARLRLGSGLVFQHSASGHQAHHSVPDAKKLARECQDSRPDPNVAVAADESVASFFRRRFGPATVGLIADPLLGGIHAGDVEQLSIKSVAPRLLTWEPSGRRPSPARQTSDDEGLFKSLKGGMGELVAAIEQRLPAGCIHLRSEAFVVSATSIAWKIASSTGTFDARAVIIAAPAHAAARLLDQVDSDLASQCAGIPYVSTVSVALAWPRTSVRHPLNGSGFVVARQHSTLRISACTWVSSKWQSRAPAGMVLLRAFLGGAADPDVAALPDASILEIAIRDLSAVLGTSGAPALARVHRWLRAGAQHNVGHGMRIARIEERLAAIPGLLVCGSGFRSIGVPDCIADGRAAGEAAARYVKIQR